MTTQKHVKSLHRMSLCSMPTQAARTSSVHTNLLYLSATDFTNQFPPRLSPEFHDDEGLLHRSDTCARRFAHATCRRQSGKEARQNLRVVMDCYEPHEKKERHSEAAIARLKLQCFSIFPSGTCLNICGNGIAALCVEAAKDML
jgi:hypothetical protein